MRIPFRRPKLGVIHEHDPRNADYPVAPLIAAARPPSEIPTRRTWELGPVTNQAPEGACIGFGWTTALIAGPIGETNVGRKVANRYGFNHYHRAKCLTGDLSNLASGTTMRNGATVALERGLVTEYRWAASIDEVRDAVLTIGPVVVVVGWYSDMWQTDKNGLVRSTRDINKYVGGHCLTLVAYDPAKKIGKHPPQPMFMWRNSWGKHYGARVKKHSLRRDGNGWIPADLLNALLLHGRYESNACVPIGRHKVDLAALLAEHPDPHRP